ncbi:hypothetical protein LX59_02476 [Azomonas agilis]|uniref:Dehydrogenase n=1 Tax=Azomonas agilis TaxID=116849 RepID=A0A562I1H4_9GAMM|nr:PA2817 family protein [Azomonas agilis]TWH64525.1 hypothetical protein LX59_02476 [Azomonas agilis]
MLITSMEQAQSLLHQMRALLVAVTEAEQIPQESHQYFLERFDELLQDPSERHSGQEIVGQMFMRYPQIAHLIPRELLWFFGGDCLHFMPDAEIERFQNLEDQSIRCGIKRMK